jgi:predicted small secreted protein
MIFKEKQMNKFWLVLLCVLLAGCSKKEEIAEQIPEVAQGYGTVKWGNTLEEVRTAYGIGEDIQPATDKDDPNIITLEQESVNEVIAVRRFRFLDDKLYEVEVQYPRTVSSSDLIDTLSEKYGRINDRSVYGIGIDINKGAINADGIMYWDTYYPHITVSLIVYEAHRYRHKVTYRWAELWENYRKEKTNRVEL